MKNLPARWTAQGWSGIASVTEPAARIDFFVTHRLLLLCNWIWLFRLFYRHSDTRM